jgi:integrase
VGTNCSRPYRKTRRPPRLYTATDIDQLLAVAAQLRPVDALTPHTFVALLSLLAATGLRISEALALRLGDLTGEG